MVVVDTSSLTVVADSVHVGDGATLQNVPPVKGQNGADGVNPGDSGLNGAPGANAFNMVLEANRLLKSSANQLIFISQVLTYYFKVHIFWEGQKILRNLHLTFDCKYVL